MPTSMTIISPKRHSSSLADAPVAQASARWRVLVVDPHSSTREMIRMILDAYSDLIEVVGEASDADEAVTVARRLSIDLVLMDTDLPNGVEAIRQIKKCFPHIVVMGTSAEYKPYLYNAMIAAGAVAFIRMEDAAELLFRSIVFAMCTYGPTNLHMAPGQPAVARNTFAVSSAT